MHGSTPSPQLGPGHQWRDEGGQAGVQKQKGRREAKSRGGEVRQRPAEIPPFPGIWWTLVRNQAALGSSEGIPGTWAAARNRSPGLSTKILKVIWRLTGFSQYTIQMVFTTHCSLKAMSLKMAPTMGTAGGTYIQRTGWGRSCLLLGSSSQVNQRLRSSHDLLQ